MIHDIALAVEKEYGWFNISEIARRTSKDRKTIKKYLEAKNLTQSAKKRTCTSKLDPYKPFLTEQLRKYPYLTARRLFRDIQNLGYKGKYTILADYLRPLREKKNTLAVYRYETQPGVQAQVDWGDLGLVQMDGEKRHIYVFSMILSYSRMRFAKITMSMNLQTLIQCHIEAFDYFGGIPQEILYDNMKTVVIKKAFTNDDTELNPTFVEFSRHYNFIIRTCKPYRPQTKGKIENTIKYIKSDFFYGTAFTSYSHLTQELERWLFRVNNQRHGTTHEIPSERLADEAAKLTSITSLPPYQIVLTEQRKVSSDSFVSYLGNKYSVPYQYANRTVILRIYGNMFKVLYCNEELCSHEIIAGKNRKVKVNEHFSGLLSETMKENSRKSFSGRPVLYFTSLDVENRSLDFYEQLSLGGSGR